MSFDWLGPGRATAGETCATCGYVFKGGEPFCGRFCEASDPAVRWPAVVLLLDIDIAASELLGHRMHDNLHPFTDEENFLAETSSRAEHAVAWAIMAARSKALGADVEALLDNDSDDDS